MHKVRGVTLPSGSGFAGGLSTIPLCWTAIFALFACTARGQALSSLSFEELAQIKVITASRVPLALNETPSAAYVITGEEVLRLGANSFAQALRYTPGIDVGQISTYQWSVSSRGFNGQFASQLLVLFDGRTLLNPHNGGVSWYNHDTFIPDLDRIEVVRGPGGSLWGTNAVNGVINILTKDAAETQGFSSRVGGGNLTPYSAGARYGFGLGPRTHARVYAKAARFAGIPLTEMDSDQGRWDRAQSGFRIDHESPEVGHLTIQGDAFGTEADTVYPFPTQIPPYSKAEYFKTRTSGMNLLATWRRNLDDGGRLQVRGYYDAFTLNAETQRQTLDQFNLDAQHTLAPMGAHRLTYALEARAMFNAIPPTRIISVPGRPRAYDQLFSVSAQDEIALARDRLALTVGARSEHNSYTGWEVSPSARLGWKASKENFFWAAVSRAVSTPTQLSNGILFTANARPPGVFNQIVGDASDSESLFASELGWRFQPCRDLFADVAVFENHYDDLLFLDRSGGFDSGNARLVPWRNALSGETRGIEAAVGWDPIPTLRIKVNGSLFDSTVIGGSVGRGDRGSSPKRKAALHASWDITGALQADLAFRFVGRLTDPRISAYEEMDARLAWQVTDRLQFELVGQNLLHPKHAEAARGFSNLQSLLPRSFYAGALLSY